MNLALFLIAAIFSLLCVGSAIAADSNYPSVDIISVTPRNPNLKPLVMSVPAAGHHKQLSLADYQPNAVVSKSAKLLSNADKLRSNKSAH